LLHWPFAKRVKKTCPSKLKFFLKILFHLALQKNLKKSFPTDFFLENIKIELGRTLNYTQYLTVPELSSVTNSPLGMSLYFRGQAYTPTTLTFREVTQ